MRHVEETALRISVFRVFESEYFIGVGIFKFGDPEHRWNAIRTLASARVPQRFSVGLFQKTTATNLSCSNVSRIHMWRDDLRDCRGRD